LISKKKQFKEESIKSKKIVRFIRSTAQIACLLEVSGWPKPGNVHRTANRPDTTYEHFLVGSVILGTSVSLSAYKGFLVAKNRLEPSNIGIGGLIKKAVYEISSAHNGGNTHLGTCLLLVPLAAAASKTYFEKELISLEALKKNFTEIIEDTKPVDTVNVYKAISLASSIRDLGTIKNGCAPDILDKSVEQKIIRCKTSLYDVMKKSSQYDTIAKELVTGMETSIRIGLKNILDVYSKTNNINMATVHTFLKILSEVPDTFIARKVGLKKTFDIAEAVKIGIKETIWISKTAKQILGLGGLETDDGRSLLWSFDRKLQTLGKDYNPGTTADITASSLMVALLLGLKF